MWSLAHAPKPLSTSIIVPTRNERGNIPEVFRRMPALSSRTEVIFVDGDSTDGTLGGDPQGHEGPAGCQIDPAGRGQGKGGRGAEGVGGGPGRCPDDLDADLTVPPEDLEKFYNALAEGCGDFVNGTRLVYPMEGEAMRSLNILGNKFFSVALSAVLGARVKEGAVWHQGPT